ncbi:hypothetical protein KC331_g12260 [Hortaea werneckii]|nr:hypothetical protein KC331_g12260 [Hortaea werneckii]KAI7713515.1 hypothetical protein KC353_g7490 [Hortaea werneckii]
MPADTANDNTKDRQRFASTADMIKVKKQQYASIAASEGGDAALPMHMRAKEEKEEHNRKLAAQFSAKGNACGWQIPDAKACQDKKFHAEDAARRARRVPSPMYSWG